MKHLILALSILIFFTPHSLKAETCQWSKIEKTEGGYLYPKECHIEVGKVIKENDLRTEQNDKLTKSLELKDLAIQKADERADIWQENSYKQYDRLQKESRLDKYENWLMFGGGMALGLFSAYLGAKAMGK